ncbi:MAG: ABC transporter ATP-binding protein [Planctomycetota bacterium]
MTAGPGSLGSSDLLVDVRDAHVDYGRGRRVVHALCGATLDVRAGECVALVGPNGSGKSTTLRLVLGLVRPRAGTVHVLGGAPGRRAARAATGFVPEEARRFGRLTGRETVDLFARLQGVGPRAERKARVASMLDAVGLETTAHDRAVGGYSRGMARRLALAAAAVAEPRLLVLDEPTSGLDPDGVDDVLRVVAAHVARGGGVLVSTHERVTVEQGCQRVVALARGQVALEGTPALLLAGDRSASLGPLFRRAADTPS